MPILEYLWKNVQTLPLKSDNFIKKKHNVLVWAVPCYHVHYVSPQCILFLDQSRGYKWVKIHFSGIFKQQQKNASGIRQIHKTTNVHARGRVCYHFHYVSSTYISF